MTATDATVQHLIDTLGFQYDLGRVLGRGGMGTVYFARERALDRDVAIKVLLPEIAAAPDARERFLREARTAARLTHPNIVPLYTFGDTGSVLYYVMGFVDGESLESRLQREGRIGPDAVASVLEELAGALAYAHEKGIVHRDIKPDNILIEHGTGRAMLTDFGIAKQVSFDGENLTKTGIIVGTPKYMSPEQAAGDRNIDGRSDIYSLGVVAYAMLAGRPPFDAPGFRELLAQQMTRVPVPLRTLAAGTPLQLATTVERCLKKDPADRWMDASRLVEALRADGDEDDNTATRMAKAGGWIVTYGLSIVFASDVGWWMWKRGDAVATRWMLAYFGLLIPISLGVDYWRMRRKGATPLEIRDLFLFAPTWWPLWWPAALRAPHDVWSRLPKAVRTIRILRSIGLAAFFLDLELTFIIVTLPKAPPGHSYDGLGMGIAGLLLGGLLALIASAAGQYLWGRKHGFSNNESDRIAATPTTKRSFWKRPQVARILSAPTSAAALRSSPESAAELVADIRRIASELTGPLRDLGTDSAAAARQLVDLLAGLDREIAKLARDADPAERRRLEQRLEASVADSENAEMRELYQAQLVLLRRLGDRLEEATARRQRVLELLRILWLQLSSMRGQLAQSAMDQQTTGRIRSLIADAERYSSELREIDERAARDRPLQEGA